MEQYLRDLKQTMKMDILRCKTVDGVLKELMVYGIVSNLVRLVMGEGSTPAAGSRGPDQLHRRAALVAGGQARRGDAEAGGQPVASGPGRAARAEAASQGVPGDEETSAGVAQSVVGEGYCGIGLTPFLQFPLILTLRARERRWPGRSRFCPKWS